MATEPAGTAESGAPSELPSIAAEILIVLMPDTVRDDTAEGSDHVTAGRTRRRGWFSKPWTHRPQCSE